MNEFDGCQSDPRHSWGQGGRQDAKEAAQNHRRSLIEFYVGAAILWIGCIGTLAYLAWKPR